MSASPGDVRKQNINVDTMETVELPVDKGWAWLVSLGDQLLRVALWNVVVAGTVKCSGMLLLEYLLLFNDSLSVTSWIGASFTLSLFVFSPLAGFLRDNTSHNTTRVIVAVATCIAAGGIFATAWTQSAYQAIITFGLIAGTSGSIMNAPLLSCIGVYFKKRRFLANSIAFAGSSVGGFILPLIMSTSIAAFGIRGALIILAGIWLNVLVVVSLMRPPTRRRLIVPTSNSTEVKLPLSTSHSPIKIHEEEQSPDQDCKHYSDVHESHDNNTKLTMEETSLHAQHSSPTVAVSKKSFKKMFLKVAKNYSEFLCTPGLPPLCFAILTANVAYYTQFFLLPPLIVDNQMTRSFAANIIAVSSIAELISRITVGIIVDKYPNMKTILLSVGFVLTASFGFVLSCIVTSPLLIIYAVVFGAFGGMVTPLVVPMLMKRVSEKHLGSAAGLFPVLAGFGSTTGPPIISMIKEKSGTYSAGLMFLSACYTLALILLWLDWYVKKRRSSHIKS